MNQLSPWASQLVLVIKNSAVNAGDIRNMGPIPVSGGSLGRKRAWQPTPIFLPEKFHRQRSLVGYSPWGKEADTAGQHTFMLLFSH